jgi:peptide/nickel transport system permease protein
LTIVVAEYKLTLRSFLLKRLAYTSVLIGFVIVFNFIIFEAMPGEVGALYACLGQPKVPAGVCQKLMEQFGYNQAIWVRFYDYVKAMLTFNFGVSFTNGQSVAYLMVSSGRLANTLLLLGTSTVMAIVIGTVSGIVVSRKRGSALDSFSVISSLTTFSLPTFFLGILLIFIFAVSLNWFPAGGTYPSNWDFLGLPPLGQQILVRLQYLFLPAATLTLFSYGGFLLLTRATMMEALSEDYVLTARAKGLSERAVLFKHAFKNASLPLITNVALSFGFILSGAIITETIFNWNGLGKWLFDSIGYKDFPVMQAMFFMIALSVIAANFISDIVYGVVDPRIKYE